MMHEDDVDTHICPECRDGKHRNCDGYTWCLIQDTATVCMCDHSHLTTS